MSGKSFRLPLLTINEAVAVAYRLAQVFGWLITTRLMILGLGANVYGFVSAIVSAAAWFQLSDLGMGNYLRTELPKLYNTTKNLSDLLDVCRKAISYVTTIIAITFFLIVFIFLLFQSIPALILKKLSASVFVSQFDFYTILILLCLYVCLTCNTNIFQSYFSAFGKQYKLYFSLIIGYIFQIGFAYCAYKWNYSTIAFVFIFLITPYIPAVLYIFFHSLKRDLVYQNKISLRLINQNNIHFLIIQLGGLVVYNLDLILISYLFTLKDVAVYSLLKMITQFPISLHANFGLQSWSLYVDRFVSERDILGVQSIFLRNLKITILASIIFIFSIYFLGPFMLFFWSEHSLTAEPLMFLLFGIYGTIFMLSNCFTTLMFAFNYTAHLMKLSFFVPLLFLISVYSLKNTFGTSSVILSQVFSLLFGLIVGIYFYSCKLKNVSLTANLFK